MIDSKVAEACAAVKYRNRVEKTRELFDSNMPYLRLEGTPTRVVDVRTGASPVIAVCRPEVPLESVREALITGMREVKPLAAHVVYRRAVRDCLLQCGYLLPDTSDKLYAARQCMALSVARAAIRVGISENEYRKLEGGSSALLRTVRAGEEAKAILGKVADKLGLKVCDLI